MSSLFSIEGKTALVTGGSSGIGKMIATGFVEAGAKVYISSRKAEVCDEVVAELSKIGECIAIPANLATEDECRRVAGEIAEREPTLDILVNNAGVYVTMPLEAMTEDEFHREFNTNVLGPMLVIRESLKHFGPRGGSVINIGSAASRLHPPNYSVYAATKGALDTVTGVLAKELAPRNIRVNAINPGATLSEGTQAAGLYGVGSEFEKQLVAMTPLGRIGTPADIAKVAVFLASDDSGWLTGEIILASGGQR